MNKVIDQSPQSLNAGVAPALRFLVAGAVNTVLSVAVYQAALFVTSPALAYGVAYVVGILFAYVAYARHVFDAPLSTKRFMLFALFYVASGCVGALVNSGLIEFFGLHARLAIFVTIAIMLPVNYFGSKWCMGRSHEKTGAAP
jgi:putative flippase GtrA